MTRFQIGSIVAAVGIVLAIIIGSMFIVRIPNGYVGVVYSPSGGVKETTMGQGWHLVGFFEKVTKVSSPTPNC